MNLKKFLVIFVVTVLTIIQPIRVNALNARDISNIARDITVKVIQVETGNNGSGVIIERQENTYSVLTSYHIAEEDGAYQIQTFDDIKHQVEYKQIFSGLDLMILTFNSSEEYTIADLGNSDDVVPLQTVFVASYPTVQSVLDLTSGKIRSIREDILINPEKNEGYAFVYSNNTLLGSSGGAVIDEKGYLIAINGAAERDITTGRNISLGIPINLFLSALDAKQQDQLEEAERRDALEEKLLANSYDNQLSLNENAEEITVKISGHSNGSGVIFLQEGDIYSVVTNQHVVPIDTDYTIRTNDGIDHQAINRQEIPGLDLAIVQFASSEDYYTATLGNSEELELVQPVYVAGFPGEQTNLRIDDGKIATIKQDVLQNPLAEEGYALEYDNNTLSGSSGGAVLDEEGILMGINGEADFDPQTGGKISQGIPINLFIDAWIELNLKSN